MIAGERIYLRELEEKDASSEYCSWLNDPVVNTYLETREATIEGLKQYIREKKDKKDCLFFGIFSRETNKHIGNVKLEPIDTEQKNTTLGILIGDKDWWNKGICVEVVKLLVDYSFKTLNLEKMEIGVVSENNAAIRCYSKAGFKIEKTEKNAIKHGDKIFDKLTMGMNKSAWKDE